MKVDAFCRRTVKGRLRSTSFGRNPGWIVVRVDNQLNCRVKEIKYCMGRGKREGQRMCGFLGDLTFLVLMMKNDVSEILLWRLVNDGDVLKELAVYICRVVRELVPPRRWR